MTDLFGHQPTTIKNPVKGYAARPGSGPVGETCGSCFHACQVQGGGSAFWKCYLQKHRWSHGPASDIRRKSPACSKWQSWVDSPEYAVLLALIKRARKDCEPQDRTGVHASPKDLKKLDKLLWVVPTDQERAIDQERAMLSPGMRITGKGEFCAWSHDKSKMMVRVV